MFKELVRHLPHYFSLAGILAVGLWGIIKFSYDITFQTVIVVSLAMAFVTWGIVHHHLHEDLHIKTVIEYIASAVLGVIILLWVLWRS